MVKMDTLYQVAPIAPTKFWISLLIASWGFVGMDLGAIAQGTTPQTSAPTLDQPLSVSPPTVQLTPPGAIASSHSRFEISPATKSIPEDNLTPSETILSNQTLQEFVKNPPINVRSITAQNPPESLPENHVPGTDPATVLAIPITEPVIPLANVIPESNSPTQGNAIAPPELNSATDPSISIPSVSDLSGETSEAEENSPMSQVTSVSQLRDVQPTDWAFQALQTLVERYGCIAGYPDGTFRGNRAMTRYEFAAGLNACLDQIRILLPASEEQIDLTTIQRLQAEFAAELATLRGRVDALEVRAAELEANQFTTTTKLFGFAWFNLNGGISQGSIQRETGRRVAGTNQPEVARVNDPEVTSSGLVWLDFVTSFTGKDSLVTQLAFGNTAGFPGPLANSYVSTGFEYTYGADFTNQGGGVNPNQVYLRELYYQFPVSESLQFVVGPRFNFFRFFEGNAFSFIFTGGPPIFNYITFNSANSTLVNAIDRGAGAIAMWKINRQFELRIGYLGESNEYLPSPPFNSATDPTQGLFGGTHTATAELTFRPSDRANLRFLYTRSRTEPIGGQICCGIAEPLLGVADDGFGGPVDNATADTFGFNFDWLIAKGFGIFGRYTYGSTNIYPITPGREDGEINVQSFQLGLAFPDLGKQGAFGMLSFVVPFDILDGEKFLVSGAGDGGTQYEVEASYFFPIGSNIALVPSLFVIANPNNFEDNPTIFIGNLRTQFNF